MTQHFLIKKFGSLVISLAIAQLAGFLGSIFTISSIPTWYQTINKPSFLPPNWLFAPVWTTLFVLMGISAWLVWKQYTQAKKLDKQKIRSALLVYGGQLLLNIAWSMIFFGWQMPWLAFLEIILLWMAILFTIILFYRIHHVAAWLLLPYLGWVSFAAVLTYAVAQLN